MAVARLAIIDGFRGFFLLFMGVVHFNDVTRSILGRINHHALGFVEDAQGFVFISGLMVGLVYGRKFLRSPTLAEGCGPILARVRTIYAHQAGLIVMLLVAALLLGARAAGDLEPYQAAPQTFTISSLLLVSTSTHMGILPMYIFFMLITPFAFWMLRRDLVAPYVAIMLLAWLAAQTSLAGYLMHQLQLMLIASEIPARFGIYFSLLGWQVLFFSGLFFGFRMAQGRLDLSFLRGAQYRVTFFIVLAAIAGLAVYDTIITWDLLGQSHSDNFQARSPRSVLAFVYPIAFALDLFAVVWLLQAGRFDPARWIRRTAAALEWVFTRRFLVVLGQHSLHVFSFHIIVYYLLATALKDVELTSPARAGVLIAASASLYLAAYGHAWLQGQAAPSRSAANAR